MLSVPGLGLILDTMNGPPTFARSLKSGHAFRPVLTICAICTLSACSHGGETFARFPPVSPRREAPLGVVQCVALHWHPKPGKLPLAQLNDIVSLHAQPDFRSAEVAVLVKQGVENTRNGHYLPWNACAPDLARANGNLLAFRNPLSSDIVSSQH